MADDDDLKVEYQISHAESELGGTISLSEGYIID